MDKPKHQQWLERWLGWFARRLINKYRPDVIAITGSVGKTGAKEAVFAVLNGSFGVRKNTGNLNNELGLPLTIIGAPSGGRNPLAWIKVFIRAKKQWLRASPYPECLVLEMAADHPGDLAYLTTIARPRVSIITAVAPVHTEFFQTVAAVAEEKSTLARVTDPDGYTILNEDDTLVRGFRDRTKARVLTYGLADKADVRASEINLVFGKPVPGQRFPPIVGTEFILHFDNRKTLVRLNGLFGQPAVYAALAGAAVGCVYGLSLEQIATSLRHLLPPPGRLRVLEGIKGAVVLDDSYNASPRAAEAALNFLAELAAERQRRRSADSRPVKVRRIAVFGEMSELGPLTEKSHQEVGQIVAAKADLLITVGDRAKIIAQGADQAGMLKRRVAIFSDQASALHLLRQELSSEDCVLVKGSQSARMEQIVKELLANPADAARLLVRQGPEWQC